MPKIAEAWVQLGTKGMGNVARDLGGVRAQVDQTSKKFDDVRVVGERTWHRLGSAVRRFLGDAKRATSITDDGKAAVEGYEQSVTGLYNSFLGIFGLDLPGFFALLTAAMKSLTVGTKEHEYALLSLHATWLGLQAIIAKFNGDGVKMIELMKEAIPIAQKMDELQNEMTKRDVNNAQKRGDAAKKEASDKRAAFMSMEDIWKNAQQMMLEGGGGGNQQPAAKPKPRVIPAGAGAKGPKKFSEMTPEQQHGYVEGAKHEEIDRLKQSGDPDERKRGYKMEEQERQLKEQRRPDVEWRQTPADKESMDAARQSKIKSDSDTYLKDALQKQADAQRQLLEQEKQMMKDQTDTLKKIEKNTKKRGLGK